MLWCYLAICAISCRQIAHGLSDQALADYLKETSKDKDWLVSTRRQLHQWPELMYEEHNTIAFIRRVLDDLDISYKYAYLPVNSTLIMPCLRSSYMLWRLCLRSMHICLLVLCMPCCRFPAAKTGVVATIGRGNPVVALRTDIDALPIHEESDVPFR